MCKGVKEDGIDLKYDEPGMSFFVPFEEMGEERLGH